ncbi:MAG: sugar ABC transporter permease [Nitrososphaeria archaeon]|nr:sugar ABC transporter permease [Nitrososphaeria archaeon]
MQLKKLADWLYVLPTLLIITLIFILPLGYTFWVSLQEKALGGAAKFIGLTNYYNILSSQILYVVLTNTLIYSFSAVFFKALIGLGVALLLNQKFPGRGLLRAYSIIPWAAPAYAVAFFFILLYDLKGFFNRILSFFGLPALRYLGPELAMSSVIFVNVWRGWPFFFLGFLSGLQAIPQEIYESAEIDGATRFKKFVYITIPNLKTVFLTVCLLSLMWTMGDFTTIFLLTRGGPLNKTLTAPIAAYLKAFASGANIPEAAALLVLILPIYMVLIYLVIKYAYGRA